MASLIVTGTLGSFFGFFVLLSTLVLLKEEKTLSLWLPLDPLAQPIDVTIGQIRTATRKTETTLFRRAFVIISVSYFNLKI